MTRQSYRRWQNIRILSVLAATLPGIIRVARAAEKSTMELPKAVQVILDNTTSLEYPRGDRLPLLLWPALDAVVEDEALQERIVRQLDERGVAVMATWDYNQRESSLANALRVARVQKKLSLPAIINANPSMYAFFNGEEKTAHVDAEGNRFFDSSFGKSHKMGCPFAVDYRYPSMKERIDYFVRAFREQVLPLDMVWGDWEIDGPHEFNRSREAAKRCTVCRANIPDMEDFAAYQELLWHCLLRGFDGIFLWASGEDWPVETRLLHEVYARSLIYREWLENGTPVHSWLLEICHFHCTPKPSAIPV